MSWEINQIEASPSGVTLAVEGTILQHSITRVAWILARSHPPSRVFFFLKKNSLFLFPSCLFLPAGEVGRDHVHN